MVVSALSAGVNLKALSKVRLHGFSVLPLVCWLLPETVDQTSEAIFRRSPIIREVRMARFPQNRCFITHFQFLKSILQDADG